MINILTIVLATTVVDGWQVMAKRGTPVIERFEGGLCLDARDASFSINRKVAVDPGETPRLRWTWRADVLPPRGDFRDAATDDQAAQLFVVFGKRRLTRLAINYIWDSNAPENTAADSFIPLVIHVKTVVVRSGMREAKQWKREERDVAADFRRLFGGEPMRVEAVRFQVNSQHTKSRARGCLAEFAFH